MFYAHSLPDRDVEAWETLDEHLRNVAARAAEFATAFDAAEFGQLVGLWHDLGKYLPEFQRRLQGDAIRVDHAGPGAVAALTDRESGGLPLAFAIAGHHAGLANLNAQKESDTTPLLDRVRDQQAAWQRIAPTIPRELWPLPIPQVPITPVSISETDVARAKRALELWTRFLFSALVDADYLETERFYDPSLSQQRGRYDSLATLKDRLDAQLNQFAADTPVNRVRAEVLADCRIAALQPPGLFSLTVPTGGGKTLSGLAFAIKHAIRYGLRRVVVAIPYTSIIEQTADVYRHIVGKANVVEHHSNIDTQQRQQQEEQLEDRRRLAAENWDAPLVVTTNVQLFESLLSNKPARCRKLHNLARSVVLLDEAQCLPLDMTATVVELLNELAARYGSSIVLSTATQPALRERESFVGLKNVREIVSDPAALAARLRRVRVSWPADPRNKPADYAEIAREITARSRVLTIVHRRKDARTLARLLPDEGRYHLSALMCPAHRRDVLAEIRTRLQTADGTPLRLVATQLVEAGVDIDFPVVYRALAGLDSCAQAAGRCDREGLRTAEAGEPIGDVVIFRAPTDPPTGVLRQGFETTLGMLAEFGDTLDLSNPKVFEDYFRRLYSKLSERPGLQAERTALNFATVAAMSNLIEDNYATPLVVPYCDAAQRIDRVRRQMTGATLRALQPYIVQITPTDEALLHALGGIERVHDCVNVLSATCVHLYEREFGLVAEENSRPDCSAFVV